MLSKLAEMISGEYLTGWLLALLLFGYLAYKEWPELRGRISSGAIKERRMEETDATLAGKSSRIEDRLNEVNEKLDRDYRRLNEFERWQRRTQSYTAESFQERELIIRGLVACLDGLHQLGANGKTEAVRDEIDTFLNKSAHSMEEV